MGDLSQANALVTEWVLVGIVITFLLLRLFVRWKLQRNLTLSDGFLVTAVLLTCFSASSDTFTYTMSKGLIGGDVSLGGDLLTDNTAEQQQQREESEVIQEVVTKLQKGLKMTYASTISYYSTLWCVKASFLLFYYNLFPAPPKDVRLDSRRTSIYFKSQVGFLRLCLHITTFLVAVGYIVMLATNLFSCLPINRNWSVDPSAACQSYMTHSAFWSTAVFHLTTDVLIYGLPFFLLPWLDMTQGRKVGLGVMFGLGSICLATAIVRCVLWIDGNSNVAEIAILCLSEQTVSIVVACCPPLRWLYKSVVRKNSSRGTASSGTFTKRNNTRAADSPSASENTQQEWGTIWSRPRVISGTGQIMAREHGTEEEIILQPMDRKYGGGAVIIDGADEEQFSSSRKL